MINNNGPLDCVVIGYNEVPFERYESFLSNYGEDTEAYRDLKFSFVNVNGRKLDYMGLMNLAMSKARGGNGGWSRRTNSNRAISRTSEPCT